MFVCVCVCVLGVCDVIAKMAAARYRVLEDSFARSLCLKDAQSMPTTPERSFRQH